MKRLGKNKRLRNNIKTELASTDIYIREIKNDVLKDRIEHLLQWYIRKATFYKNLFYIMSVTVIIINASIPIINMLKFQFYNNTVSIISGIASLFTSCITLFTMKDTWFRYRKSVELIKRECILFAGKCECYEDDNREGKLIINIENIITNEREAWENTKFDKSNNKK